MATLHFRRRSTVVVLALALALAAGCGGADDSGDTTAATASEASSAAAGSEMAGSEAAAADDGTRVVTADNGDITVPAAPQAIVGTGYAVATLIETDAPLVGVSGWARGLGMFSDEDAATYEELPKVAGEQAAETNYEAIAEAEPDLIVIGVPVPFLGDLDMERLESIAPVVAAGPMLPSQWRDVSQTVADAAGTLDAFDEDKAAYEERAAELTETYADVLPELQLAHVGLYGQPDQGNFQREFDGSWGTNVANDIGATYYGEVAEPGQGSAAVSEYPSLEELSDAFADADAITYSVNPDGSVPESVQYVLDSKLWKNLPAVKDGQTYPIAYTEAATYEEAMLALDAIEESFAPLLEQ